MYCQRQIPIIFFLFTCKQICLQTNENLRAHLYMDSDHGAKFQLHTSSGFWGVVLEPEQQQQREEEFWKVTFLNN